MKCEMGEKSQRDQRSCRWESLQRTNTPQNVWWKVTWKCELDRWNGKSTFRQTLNPMKFVIILSSWRRRKWKVIHVYTNELQSGREGGCGQCGNRDQHWRTFWQFVWVCVCHIKRAKLLLWTEYKRFTCQIYHLLYMQCTHILLTP